jgi:hypothetical protein
MNRHRCPSSAVEVETAVLVGAGRGVQPVDIYSIRVEMAGVQV